MELTVNKILCGDCLEKMKDIPDGSVDMVLTDPPYGTTACKWDTVIPLEPMWEQLKRVIKPNGAIVMTASQPFTTTLIASNMKMFKYCWYWEKPHTGQLNCKKMPLKNIEEVCIFQDSISYNPQFTKGKPYTLKRKNYKGSDCYGKQIDHTTISNGKRYPKQILKFSEGNKVHPTQKPVALMEYLIKTYTNEGDLVLDFACGSGTTCVACVNTGRNYIGIEKVQKYVDITRQRIAEAEENK